MMNLEETLKARVQESGIEQTQPAGRPKGSHIRTDELAKQFLAAEKGCVDYRYYAGNWYRYAQNQWGMISLDEMRGMIIAFLQRNCAEEMSVTQNLCHNVLVNLMSVNMCLLLQNEYTMPCWLSSKKSAGDCIVFENGMMNIQERLEIGKGYSLMP